MERWLKYSVFLAVCLLIAVLYYHEFSLVNAGYSATFLRVPKRNVSLTDELKFFLTRNTSACRVYYEFGGMLNRKPSLVFLDGQKSVCLDEGVSPKANDCYVYSFGNNGEWSFDEHIEAYGCKVFVFDPSVWYWNHRHSKNIWFYRIGLSDEDDERNANGWQMMSLSSIRKKLNHTNVVIDYLKIDIEGGEWRVLNDWMRSGALARVKQLAIEVHLYENIAEKREIIERLEASGFVRFFARENPWSADDYWAEYKIHDPSCYELAWYNRKFYVKK